MSSSGKLINLHLPVDSAIISLANVYLFLTIITCNFVKNMVEFAMGYWASLVSESLETPLKTRQ